MEKFNSFEFNAENVIGGTLIAPTSITTPCITVPSLTATVNPTPTVTTTSAIVAGAVAQVGSLASTVIAAAPTVSLTSGTTCGCC